MPSGPIRQFNDVCVRLCPILSVVGRIVLVYIFFDSGFDRLTGGYAASEQFMRDHGVSTVYLPFATALEFLGSIFIALGLLTRLSAFGLAVFSVIAAFLFFPDFADDTQWIAFLDNFGLAGGLIVLMAFGPGPWSLDRRLKLEG